MMQNDYIPPDTAEVEHLVATLPHGYAKISPKKNYTNIISNDHSRVL